LFPLLHSAQSESAAVASHGNPFVCTRCKTAAAGQVNAPASEWKEESPWGYLVGKIFGETLL
jgi:hypothetical protein